MYRCNFKKDNPIGRYKKSISEAGSKYRLRIIANYIRNNLNISNHDLEELMELICKRMTEV